MSSGKLGIHGLVLGEQTEENYQKWFDRRWLIAILLRVETTNRELYKKLHPAGPQFWRIGLPV